MVPGDTLVLVGVGVGETLDLAGLATEEAEEVRADLVGTALFESVAGSTAGLENMLASFNLDIDDIY